MDDYPIPGLGTYQAAGWGGTGAPESYTPPIAVEGRPPVAAEGGPPREADATPTSYSQVPGTSGAPNYTPSATHGGVSAGSGTGTPSAPFSLAGLLGLNAPQAAAGATRPGQGMKIAQLGMRMLAPPASPLRPGAPAPRLSTAGQNPMLAQIQNLYGVDASTAQMMLQTLYGGGATMQPQQSQLLTSGMTAQAQPGMTPPNPLLPSSAMPTAAQPYGVPRMGMATPTAPLPPLTQGAYSPAGGYSQGLFGIPAMAEGGRPTGPTIVGERGPEIFVPDMPGAIVPMPRTPQSYDAILRALELGARIQRRRFGMPEEGY